MLLLILQCSKPLTWNGNKMDVGNKFCSYTEHQKARSDLCHDMARGKLMKRVQ